MHLLNDNPRWRAARTTAQQQRPNIIIVGGDDMTKARMVGILCSPNATCRFGIAAAVAHTRGDGEGPRRGLHIAVLLAERRSAHRPIRYQRRRLARWCPQLGRHKPTSFPGHLQTNFEVLIKLFCWSLPPSRASANQWLLRAAVEALPDPTMQRKTRFANGVRGRTSARQGGNLVRSLRSPESGGGTSGRFERAVIQSTSRRSNF
jgi:hypothetical protein